MRRGNQAARQLQLGSYGDLLETAQLYVDAGNSFDGATADPISDALDKLVEIWRKKDAGIWELSSSEHYTVSKIAVWTAFDRALRLVDDGQLPLARADAWRAARNDVREFVERECWSEARGCYAMHAGTTDLDASLLRISRTGYLEPRGEPFSRVIDAIREELSRAGRSSIATRRRWSGRAFVACSFWLVEALSRAGRLDEARALMDDLVALANDVGLFAEQIDPPSRAFLGNLPQGLSHLSLINAAAAIRDVESD